MERNFKLAARFFWFGAILSVLLIFSGGAAAKALPQTVTVSMYDDYFSPSTLLLSPGQKVVWINKGHKSHTVTSKRGDFNSGRILPGDSFSLLFVKPGTYHYSCSYHSFFIFGMKGEVVVRKS